MVTRSFRWVRFPNQIERSRCHKSHLLVVPSLDGGCHMNIPILLSTSSMIFLKDYVRFLAERGFPIFPPTTVGLCHFYKISHQLFSFFPFFPFFPFLITPPLIVHRRSLRVAANSGVILQVCFLSARTSSSLRPSQFASSCGKDLSALQLCFFRDVWIDKGKRAARYTLRSPCATNQTCQVILEW